VLAKRGNDLEAMKALRIALVQQPESPDAKSLLGALERRLASDLADQLASDRSGPVSRSP
jgi:hypothetical protein